MKSIWNLCAIGFAVAAFQTASEARPKYATKEKKACGYCHTKPMGGGERNEKGLYYEMHNLSFAGLPPAYKSALKIEVPKGTRKIGVADLAGDGMFRLLTLGEGSKLTVHKIVEGAPKAEAEVNLGANAAKFVAGTFAKDQPGAIVVPGAVFVKDGDKYAKKDAKDINDISGTVRYLDGTTNVFYFDGAGAPATWAINTKGDKLTKDGREMVPPDQGAGVYYEIAARLPAEVLAGLRVPEAGQKLGFIGIQDSREEKKLYAIIPLVAEGGSTFIVIDAADLTKEDAKPKPVYTSGKLGKIVDITLGGDIKGGKATGVYVLYVAEDGKTYVEFLALD